MWEDGRFDALVDRVLGQQAETDRRSASNTVQTDEKLGKRARRLLLVRLLRWSRAWSVA